jgi:hypothetical protein
MIPFAAGETLMNSAALVGRALGLRPASDLTVPLGLAGRVVVCSTARPSQGLMVLSMVMGLILFPATY